MEVEIKLTVRPAIPGGPEAFFARLAALTYLGGYTLGPIVLNEIRDVYFDAQDNALAASGAGLRLRIENGRPFVTLKANRVQAGALSWREEFQEPLTQEHLDQVLSHVTGQVGTGPFPVGDFAAGRPCGTLVPVLDVSTTRWTRAIGAVAELDLDTVRYSGLAVGPFYDLEVEAHGQMPDEQALRWLESDLHAQADGHLDLTPWSKLERGLRLIRRDGL